MSYKNKLTACFDDILKVSAEMMMQQQLKNVQLDPYMVNGFSAQQQNTLKEKIHMFHGILDDLENMLSKSTYYVDTLANLGKESKRQKELELEKQREQEEEEKKQKLLELERKKKEQEEEEEKKKKQKEEEEKRKKELEEQERKKKEQEEEEKRRRQQEQDGDKQQSMFDGLDFTNADLDTSQPGTSGQNDIKSPTMGAGPQSAGTDKPNTTDGPDKTNPPIAAFGLGDSQSGGLYNDLNTMDLSMFSELDGGGFDASGFDTANTSNANATTNSVPNNNNPATNDSNMNNDPTAAMNAFDGTAAGNNETLGQGEKLEFDQSNPSAMLGNDINMGDNGEDYLTLNDFNDLNIDWSAAGEGGDLDLNGFNI